MTRVVDCFIEDPRLRLSPEAVEACLAVIDKRLPFPPPAGDLAMVFVREDRCRRLHRDFYNDPALTDVMTFPGEAEDGHSGDLAICPAVAVAAAPGHGHSFAEELTLYLLHGCLHLAGFRDSTAAEVRTMKAAETEGMRLLREAGALLPADWTADAGTP